MATHLGQICNVVPLLAPVDLTTTNPVLGAYLDLQSANWATFYLSFGVVTSATAADTMTLTVECSTASTSNATEEAMAFNYRVSTTIASGNVWGAVTAATSAGFSLGASTVFDGFSVLIDVDPAAVVEKRPDARYVRVVATPGGDGAYSAILHSAVAFIEPRYRETTMIKATVT